MIMMCDRDWLTTTLRVYEGFTKGVTGSHICWADSYNGYGYNGG